MEITPGQCTVGKKNKAVPLSDPGGPQGCEMLRILYCLDSRLTDGGGVVRLMHRPRFTPQAYSWYPFVLDSESTPGP
jgi:hypothetical protein